MKKIHLLTLLATLTAGLCLTGCDTFESRAKEKSEVYDALSPNTQKRLERGKINPGDTEDMVYIALGDPDEKRDIQTTNNTQGVWIYRSYWEQYEGTAWVGWHRQIVPSPTGRGYIIYHEPITRDVYRTHIDEIIRVTFVAGQVTAVDQQKR